MVRVSYKNMCCDLVISWVKKTFFVVNVDHKQHQAMLQIITSLSTNVYSFRTESEGGHWKVCSKSSLEKLLLLGNRR